MTNQKNEDNQSSSKLKKLVTNVKKNLGSSPKKSRGNIGTLALITACKYSLDFLFLILQSS